MVMIRWIAAICCMVIWAGMPARAQDSGATIYQARCLMCHGADGKAGTPAGLAFKAAAFNDPAIVRISDADRIEIVKKGKGKMPVFGDKLSDDQIKSVLAYIRTLEK
jgi:mono/diheme cytochrome c family protein